jgi:hypothetical protein
MRPFLLLLGVSALGCTFDDLDHTGKTCPCSDGYACDWESNTCVKPAAGCQSLVGMQDFRIAWTTPNSIAWQWNALGDGKDFGGYRLHYGRGESPDTGSEQVQLSSEENPELGLWEAPYTGDTFLIQLTMAQELQPETLYWARLEVQDATGCSYQSPIVTATTDQAPPLDQTGLVVFDDALPPNVWTGPVVPAELVKTDPANAYAGTSYLEWVSDGTSGENIQILEYDFPYSLVGENLERSAFLEFAVSLEQTSNSYYSRVFIDGSAPSAWREARFEGFTVKADGKYRLFQIPVRALQMADGGPFYTSTDHFQKFAFGCSPFLSGAVIRLDQIRMRW